MSERLSIAINGHPDDNNRHVHRGFIASGFAAAGLLSGTPVGLGLFVIYGVEVYRQGRMGSKLLLDMAESHDEKSES